MRVWIVVLSAIVLSAGLVLFQHGVMLLSQVTMATPNPIGWTGMDLWLGIFCVLFGGFSIYVFYD